MSSNARERAVERLAAVLCGIAEDGDEGATPRAADYHERVGSQLLAPGGAEHARRIAWTATAVDALRVLGLVAVDPALVEAVRDAREWVKAAEADYAEIREKGEDSDAWRRLRAACERRGEGADPGKAWRWIVPVAEEALEEAERALADAVLAQIGPKS